MADFSTSDFVQSRIETVLKDVEILTERYDEKNNFYEVQVQMPKVKLINILEEYNNMWFCCFLTKQIKARKIGKG